MDRLSEFTRRYGGRLGTAVVTTVVAGVAGGMAGYARTEGTHLEKTAKALEDGFLSGGLTAVAFVQSCCLYQPGTAAKMMQDLLSHIFETTAWAGPTYASWSAVGPMTSDAIDGGITLYNDLASEPMGKDTTALVKSFAQPIVYWLMLGQVGTQHGLVAASLHMTRFGINELVKATMYVWDEARAWCGVPRPNQPRGPLLLIVNADALKPSMFHNCTALFGPFSGAMTAYSTYNKYVKDFKAPSAAFTLTATHKDSGTVVAVGYQTTLAQIRRRDGKVSTGPHPLNNSGWSANLKFALGLVPARELAAKLTSTKGNKVHQLLTVAIDQALGESSPELAITLQVFNSLINISYLAKHWFDLLLILDGGGAPGSKLQAQIDQAERAGYAHQAQYLRGLQQQAQGIAHETQNPTNLATIKDFSRNFFSGLVSTSEMAGWLKPRELSDGGTALFVPKAFVDKMVKAPPLETTNGAFCSLCLLIGINEILFAINDSSNINDQGIVLESTVMGGGIVGTFRAERLPGGLAGLAVGMVYNMHRSFERQGQRERGEESPQSDSVPQRLLDHIGFHPSRFGALAKELMVPRGPVLPRDGFNGLGVETGAYDHRGIRVGLQEGAGPRGRGGRGGADLGVDGDRKGLLPQDDPLPWMDEPDTVDQEVIYRGDGGNDGKDSDDPNFVRLHDARDGLRPRRNERDVAHESNVPDPFNTPPQKTVRFKIESDGKYHRKDDSNDTKRPMRRYRTRKVEQTSGDGVRDRMRIADAACGALPWLRALAHQGDPNAKKIWESFAALAPETTDLAKISDRVRQALSARTMTPQADRALREFSVSYEALLKAIAPEKTRGILGKFLSPRSPRTAKSIGTSPSLPAIRGMYSFREIRRALEWASSQYPNSHASIAWLALINAAGAQGGKRDVDGVMQQIKKSWMKTEDDTVMAALAELMAVLHNMATPTPTLGPRTPQSSPGMSGPGNRKPPQNQVSGASGGSPNHPAIEITVIPNPEQTNMQPTENSLQPNDTAPLVTRERDGKET